MRERFSSSEWQTLLRLPGVVFYTVALADGEADAQEVERFKQFIASADIGDPLLFAIVQALLEQGRVLHYEAPSTYPALLDSVRNCLEAHLSESEYVRFTSELMRLGRSVAEASGGFLGLGNKVSSQERRSLESLARSFGFEDGRIP